MISQREIVEFLRKNMNKSFSETTLRKYIYDLLQVLSDKDLEKLLENAPQGIRVHSLIELRKRLSISRIN